MNIAILGYGVVGKGVEKIALEKDIQVKYILMRDIDELTLPNMTKSLDEILNDREVDCVVECIGGIEPAHTYVAKALKCHKHVVSSNKKMLVKCFDELYKLAKENNVSLLFQAACGGGIPWIRELSYIKEIETVKSIKGIMNGTSNYILDKIFKENLDFSLALKNAQELGYAESNPSDDIDGIDTANKVVLSMITAFGYGFELNDLFIKGIRYFNKKDLDFANNNEYKCVLLGKGIKDNDNYIPYVIPSFVKKNSSIFSNINDNYNCFKVDSDNLNNLLFIGQGAGSLPTASNVVRDILTVNNPYPIDYKGIKKPDYDSYKTNFYIRTCNKIGTSIIKEKLDEDSYITNKISLNVLKDIINENDFVGEIEND